MVIFVRYNEAGNVIRAKRSILQSYFTYIPFIVGLHNPKALGIIPGLVIRKVEVSMMFVLGLITEISFVTFCREKKLNFIIFHLGILHFGFQKYLDFPQHLVSSVQARNLIYI